MLNDPRLVQLVADLASPDPYVRDTTAYAALARICADGELSSSDGLALGGAMVERLAHERAEARSFAPLVLAALVEGDVFEPSWVPAVTDWYVAEADLRGYDEGVGWIHAVAHGADFFGACGASGVGEPDELLHALALRLVAPTDAVWRDQEDDRVACAIAQVLAHPALDPARSVDWLGPVQELFAMGAPGPVPPEASNTMRTLRSLHVALGQQVVHRGRSVPILPAGLVRAEVTQVLAQVTPWFWRAGTRAGEQAGYCKEAGARPASAASRS